MTIYKITNRLNGKIYIGQTSQPLEKRFYQHSKANTPLGNAMRQCGLENFTIEIVEKCHSQEEVNDREKFWIGSLNCKLPCGYNQNDGGTCGLRYSEKEPSKSSLEIFVEENGLTDGDKKFLEAFIALSPEARAILTNFTKFILAQCVLEQLDKMSQNAKAPTAQATA